MRCWPRRTNPSPLISLTTLPSPSRAEWPCWPVASPSVAAHHQLHPTVLSLGDAYAASSEIADHASKDVRSAPQTAAEKSAPSPASSYGLAPVLARPSPTAPEADTQVLARLATPLTVARPPGIRARLAEAMEALFPGSSRTRRRFGLDVVELPPDGTPRPARRGQGARLGGGPRVRGSTAGGQRRPGRAEVRLLRGHPVDPRR